MPRKPKKPVKKVAKKKKLGEREAIRQYIAEIRRMKAELRTTKNKLARKLIESEIAEREWLLREWREDIERR